jgi:23S rRNA (cytidine1920-2'-O)/16S rRNA (cytidine1409-2'-O)-methyltransferase
MTRYSRLDQIIVERGMAASRTKAQALISDGKVLVNGCITKKSSTTCDEETVIEVSGLDHPWVGRGGLKLAHALNHFGVDVRGKIAMDIGASTGGFTDVLLHYGASLVYAIDVGRDQLHSKLRSDGRVISLEETDIRTLTRSEVLDPVDMLVCDVSFISLTKALAGISRFVHENSEIITLVKPQFEAGKQNIGKDGLVKDPDIQEKVLSEIREWFTAHGWQTGLTIPSPVNGGKSGNQEFLMHAVYGACTGK